MSKPIAPSERAPAAFPVSRAVDRRLAGIAVLAALVAYPFVAAFAIERGLSAVVHAAPIAVNLALAAWFATPLGQYLRAREQEAAFGARLQVALL